MQTMMKPLIKYTGGKYDEYDKIKKYFPSIINNYFEPFFGGGGVFFRLLGDSKITGNTSINDYSSDLIDFYKSVSVDTFSIELYKLSAAWDCIKSLGKLIYEEYGTRFGRLMLERTSEKFVNDEVSKLIKDAVSKITLKLHGISLSDKIEKELESKIKRFNTKVDKEEKYIIYNRIMDIFNEYPKQTKLKNDICIWLEDSKYVSKKNEKPSLISEVSDFFENRNEEKEDIIYKCITTSVCQGFYFVIRDMYNEWNNHGKKEEYTLNERSAQWFFIREYCFGSMFRFGKNGDFNIPYGGFTYNDKCFTCKIENITSEECKDIFKSINICCEDFEKPITEWKYDENDFMFLDPPYDSTFTDYDNIPFTRDDHKRLASCLKQCKCKWLMVIGKTDFICDLYKDCFMVEYDKTYMYQAKGGYDNKHTTHLVITNYDITNG